MTRLTAALAVSTLLFVGLATAQAAPKLVPPRTIFLESQDMG